MKRALLDSSSAILLYKADLLVDLVAVYDVLITSSVKYELTSQNRPGTDNFLNLLHMKKIKETNAEKVPGKHEKLLQVDNTLDRGESDTIKYFQTGGSDFIIIDDGRAAKYCSLHEIPFINALLFPRVLYFMNRLTVQECNEKMSELCRIGYYSSEVVKWAANCKKEALYFAISLTSA